MRKAAGHISAILKGILFIGFSIQIILGIIWMCFNLTHLRQFVQTEGVLYGCLRDFTGSYYGILYVCQLVLGYFAAGRFLNSICTTGRWFDVWRRLVLIFFPMAMQCHLSVAPYSLVSSVLLMELGTVVSILRNREQGELRAYAVAGGCWLVLGLLLPEYFILGAVPILVLLFCRLPILLKNLRLLGLGVVLFLAFGGMLWSCNTLRGEKCFPGKEDVAFSLCSRTAWPTMWNDRGEWPQEVLAATESSLWQVSLYADNMQEIFRPLMTERFGDEAAGYYLDMAEIAWKKHAGMIIRQVGWDALGYSVTPLILPLQLQGEAYASYSGRNYEFMFMEAPAITKSYVRYSCWWFGVMLLLAVCSSVSKLLHRGIKLQKGDLTAVVLCVTVAGVVITAYTLRGAGVMDYKCTVAVNLLWLAAALLSMEEECSEKA